MTDPSHALIGGFDRHISDCNNTSLPGSRHVLILAGEPIGYVEPSLLATGLLSDLFQADPATGTTAIASSGTLQRAADRLARADFFVHRGEDFDVRATENGPVLATLDRGALPSFGIAATGVHLNGLVERGSDLFLWVARRAASKLLDPGKLDHLAAGGVPAGLTPNETLAKEAAEECGLTRPEIDAARRVGTIRYAMQRPEGLRRDVLCCYDVVLPEHWQPVAYDGEVEAFELWPLLRAYEAVRDGDAFKFNVNLVLIDLFLRRGLIDAGSVEGQRLARGLRG